MRNTQARTRTRESASGTQTHDGTYPNPSDVAISGVEVATSISLSPVEQKQRNTTLSDFEDIEASSKYTSYARANSNCLASPETIRTTNNQQAQHIHAQTRTWVGLSRRHIAACRRPSSPATQNYFLGQDYFSQGKKKGAYNKKKRAVIIHVPYECDPALLPGGSGILPHYPKWGRPKFGVPP